MLGGRCAAVRWSDLDRMRLLEAEQADLKESAFEVFTELFFIMSSIWQHQS